MNTLWTVYHEEIPAFLHEFSQTPHMLRLQHVGMNCGCEYTHFPRFLGLDSYSRYDHSLGVALIVWHFTGSMEQTLAGLFHDVTTPVFAHVVDFLNGDHLRQESTEAGIAELLAASTEICTLLKKYGLTVEQVADYHYYPVADNDAPALAADRLEYTMGNLLNYGFATLQEICGFYEDLTVGVDERGQPELAFCSAETAAAFAKAALKNSRVYVADEDRFAMQALADLLRSALRCGKLTREDLLTTEPLVLKKLTADSFYEAEWRKFCGYSQILREKERPQTGYWVRIDAKKRWIDPMVSGKGRVSQWDDEFAKELAEFQALDFSGWLSAT